MTHENIESITGEDLVPVEDLVEAPALLTDLPLSEATQSPSLPLVTTEFVPETKTPTRPKKTHRNGDNSQSEEDSIKMYLTDIGKHPLLTKEDEVKLAQVYEKGRAAATELAVNQGKGLSPNQKRQLRAAVKEGDQAQLTFINSNLRLVVSIAKKYQSSGLPLLDLIQEGNFGLMHAVDKFEWQQGFKFSTYATWWVRQSIARGIANKASVIRLPVHAGDNLANLRKAQNRIALRKGSEATIAELAEELDLPEAAVSNMLQFDNLQNPLSLDAPVREDGDATVGDFTPDPDSAKDYDQADRDLDLVEGIAAALASLDGRERFVITRRFGLDGGQPGTLEAVGQPLGITRERVRQIQARAMCKLRHPSNNIVPGLAVYLGKD